MADQFKQHCEQIRNRIVASQSKMMRVAQGKAQGQDSLSIGSEIGNLEQDVVLLEKEYKNVLNLIDQGEARQADEQMRYIREKTQGLQKQYKTHMSQNYQTFAPQVVNPEDVNVENMQKMQMKKNEQMADLSKDIKQLGRVNKDIKEELNKSDEIMGDLKNNIGDANTKVVHVKNSTSAFSAYLKRNKVPFPMTILILIITVLVWSSQAFCKWGLTFQCP